MAPPNGAISGTRKKRLKAVKTDDWVDWVPFKCTENNNLVHPTERPYKIDVKTRGPKSRAGLMANLKTVKPYF